MPPALTALTNLTSASLMEKSCRRATLICARERLTFVVLMKCIFTYLHIFQFALLQVSNIFIFFVSVVKFESTIVPQKVHCHIFGFKEERSGQHVHVCNKQAIPFESLFQSSYYIGISLNALISADH